MPISPRASASRRRCPTGRSRSGSQAPLPASCSTRARAWSSCCPARRASCSGCGRARSPPSRCSGCSPARRRPDRRVLRFYGASESAVAKALADAGGDGDGVEVTICARDFEIHVDLIVEPGAEERADALESGVRGARRRVPLRPRRALGAGARARAVPGSRPHARHGGVVHRRARRRPAHVGRRLERRLPRRRRRLRQRRQGGVARRPGRAARGARRRVGRGGGCDGAAAPASGSGSTSPCR